MSSVANKTGGISKKQREARKKLTTSLDRQKEYQRQGRYQNRQTNEFVGYNRLLGKKMKPQCREVEQQKSTAKENTGQISMAYPPIV